MASVYLSNSTQPDNIYTNGMNEAYTMTVLTDLVAEKLKAYPIVVYRNNTAMGLRGTVEDSNNKSPDIHVAFHTNAGGGTGCEWYYYGDDEEGRRLATCLYNHIAPITNAPDRGVKSDRTLYTTGLYELAQTTAIATLGEIIFHDNSAEVADYLAKVDAIADGAVKGICEYFGIAYITPVQPKNGLWLVQCGAFKIETNADLLIQALAAKGFKAVKKYVE